jgi:hypothetical protein
LVSSWSPGARDPAADAADRFLNGACALAIVLLSASFRR